ncbi:MAG: SpoIIE family protein phosphatase [Limisphaerales bacterium]
MMATFPRTSRAVTFELSLPCDLEAVRPAVGAVRAFLTEQELHQDEITTCQLALVEACNNAIQYAGERGCGEPVEIKVICNGSKVELQVRDHTAGFSWPRKVALPEVDCERGRGLFLIQSLMQTVSYLRGDDGNSLVMSKSRLCQGYRHSMSPPGNLREANRRLAEREHVVTDMARELCVRTESLSAIFRCSAELGRTNDLKDFSQRLLNDLLHITSADWFILRVVSREPQRLEVFAISEPCPGLDALPVNDPAAAAAGAESRAARSRQEIRFDPDRPLDAADPLQPLARHSAGIVSPLFLRDRLVGTLAVGRELVDVGDFSPGEAEVVRTFAGFLAIQFVNAKWQEEQVHVRLVARELEIARNIQRALLPKSLPELPGFELAAFCQSARQVGGDLYDVLQVSDHSLLLMVADVMGKGIPAAMFAAILRSLVRVSPEWTRRPSELLSRMNRLLFDDLSEVDMFITAQLVSVDVKQRRLTAASAGHCPVLLASADTTRVQAVSPEGMPLGILPAASFTDETVALGNGCRLLLYTDGLTESRDPAGEFFGQPRLMRWLEQTVPRRMSAGGMKGELTAELAAFHASEPLRDDQTFLVLAETGGAVEPSPTSL